ncbi:hypothetical protein ONT01_02175 [Prevotella copri]|uniref:Uncharacterized protein n=1 Tax=Segatella copri TaxID=165179 RepID=A0AAW5UHW6_9BACT|nr:hypothetical protein [Segatella copri]MCW4136600.1 hypothetical protein [Segatella copri]MCW4166838.1 hypothetical protein [Segatella copri]
MEQITIDFKNAFDCSKKEKSKVCRSGYVRVVRFMDDKKHTRAQVYEGDLLEAIMDVKRGNVKNFDTLEDMMDYLEA